MWDKFQVSYRCLQTSLRLIVGAYTDNFQKQFHGLQKRAFVTAQNGRFNSFIPASQEEAYKTSLNEAMSKR